MISGVRRRLVPGWGRVSKVVSKKTHFDAKGATHLGACFRNIRLFPTLYFSDFFEVTLDSKLYALWCPKGPQKEAFGKPFRSDFEVSGESENEALIRTGASFSRF